MSFLAKENTDRLSTYKKDESEEDFLKKLNQSFHNFESNSQYEKKAFPWVFVTGLPRSGTTLLMQCLATAFDFSFVNNFMARFWDAPVSAARMSKILFGNQRFRSAFKSDFGKSNALDDVHEWSYFWIKHLNYSRSIDFNRVDEKGRIDWKEIQNILNGITAVFNKPFLNKALHPAKYIDAFLEINPNILFVHIERDFLENCQSILNAREQYYGDRNKWWSLIPDNFEDIKDFPYEAQIPEQLGALSREMKNDLNEYARAKFINVEYDTFCDNPHQVLEKIANELKRRFQSDFAFDVESIPEKFERRARTHFDAKLKTYVNEHFQN